MRKLLFGIALLAAGLVYAGSERPGATSQRPGTDQFHGSTAGGDLQGTYPNPTAISGITRDTEWNSVLKIEMAVGFNILVSTEVNSLAKLDALAGSIDIITSTRALVNSLIAGSGVSLDASSGTVTITLTGSGSGDMTTATYDPNTDGIFAVANGGTGANSASGARTNLSLGNVDNTSDANKPISTAQQTQFTAVAASTNTTASVLSALATSTTSTAAQLSSIASSTTTLNASTVTLASQFTTVAIDTTTLFNVKVSSNASITGATKTKITYDAKGLVTAGADATTADIADSSNKRYITDAQQTILGNTSGTNTGDQNLSGYATTAYVDASILGLDWKQAAMFASAAALPTNVYANGSSGVGATLTGFAFGAITVDGYTPSIGQRILVKNEVTAANNGIYTVTAVGGGAAFYVLTRATDHNQTSEIQAGDSVFITSGTANVDSSWIVTTDGAVTVGTTAINWSQFAASYSAGGGLTLTGTQFSIDSTSGTLQGNSFGGANQLIKAGSDTYIPNAQVDSSSVTKLGPSIDLSGAEATGTLAAARVPALTGDVTSSAGSLTTTVANVPNAAVNSSSITKQGNTFNAANNLLQLDSGGLVPNAQIDSSSVTKLGPSIDLSGAEATGILAAARFPSSLNPTNVTVSSITLNRAGVDSAITSTSAVVLRGSGTSFNTLQIFGSSVSIGTDQVATASNTMTFTNKSIDASQLTGSVADGRLSANVSLLGSAIDLSGAEATGTLAAARFPALTGAVTTSAGSLATSFGTTTEGWPGVSPSSNPYLTATFTIGTATPTVPGLQVALAATSTYTFVAYMSYTTNSAATGGVAYQINLPAGSTTCKWRMGAPTSSATLYRFSDGADAASTLQSVSHSTYGSASFNIHTIVGYFATGANTGNLNIAVSKRGGNGGTAQIEVGSQLHVWRVEP